MNFFEKKQVYFHICYNHIHLLNCIVSDRRFFDCFSIWIQFINHIDTLNKIG